MHSFFKAVSNTVHVPYILFEDTLVWVFLSNAQVFMLSLIVKEELI